MNNPNILFTRKDTAELVDRPMPEPGAGEVRVKLVRSTVSSGTERANVTGCNVVSIWDPPDAPVVWPRQSGYSSSGIVDAVGEGVKSVRPGDRVAMSWTLHSKYVVVPEDRVYALPFTRKPHPSYREKIPAIDEVRFSITSCRGCFGGCNFCALTFHQGRVISSRSHESILKEAQQMTKDKDFHGYIHDVGGPTANFR